MVVRAIAAHDTLEETLAPVRAERDSDMGGGAVFHDNRVEVSAV